MLAPLRVSSPFALLLVVGAAAACGLPPGTVHNALNEGRDPSDALSSRLGSSPGEKPKELHNDTGRLLLERATLSLRKGNHAAAARDFELADMLLDREDMRRMAKMKAMHSLGAFEACWQNGWAEAANVPYGPKVYEHLLINPLAIIARLGSDDAKGAAVEARRFAVMDDFVNGFAKERARSIRPFAEGLGAVAFARNGENESACRAVKRTDGVRAFEAACNEGNAAPRTGAFLIVGYGQTPFIESNGVGEKATKTLIEPKNEGKGPRAIDISLDGASLATPAVATLDIANEVREDFREATTVPHVNTRVLGAWHVPCGAATEAWDALPAALHVAWVPALPGPHEIAVSVNRMPQTFKVNVNAEAPVVVVRFVE